LIARINAYTVENHCPCAGLGVETESCSL